MDGMKKKQSQPTTAGNSPADPCSDGVLNIMPELPGPGRTTRTATAPQSGKTLDAARKTAGDFRFGTEAGRAALAEGCRRLCPLYNYWMPLFRLVAEERREGGRYRKACEKEPGTPYERLMESPDISEE
jgi:hypothetical protein